MLAFQASAALPLGWQTSVCPQLVLIGRMSRAGPTRLPNSGTRGRSRAMRPSRMSGATDATARVSKCQLGAGLCQTRPERLGPKCEPGPVPSPRHVDLTGFRTGAYGVKAMPGPQVNRRAKKWHKMALGSRFFDSLWCQLEVQGSYPKHGLFMVYDVLRRTRHPRVECHFGRFRVIDFGAVQLLVTLASGGREPIAVNLRNQCGPSRRIKPQSRRRSL